MATILLVDNDPLQAILRKSILEQRFSDVQRVTDAAEALCLGAQHQFAANLGLVVSGRHMPGIGGPAFVTELHARMPSLPVLVLGNPGESPGDYAGDHVCFLAHPISAKELLTRAGQLLEEYEHTAA
jgi:CheY-like chemotaxis protein